MRIIKVLFYSLIVFVGSSCDNREKAFEYYDIEETKVKTEAEYLNGKLDGKTLKYFPSGEVMELSNWKSDTLVDITAFHKDGKFGAKEVYSKGKLIKHTSYFSNGSTQKEMSFDIKGNSYNSKSYDDRGQLLPMQPIFFVSSDTISLGDTIKIKAQLVNVSDDKYLKGTLIAGSKFLDSDGGILADTLAVSHTTANDYYLSLVPNIKGMNRLWLQFVFTFPITRNGTKLDTLEIFGLRYDFRVK